MTATLDLRTWADREPRDVAVRCAGIDTTYGELESQANRIAHVLRNLGIGRGDHVAAIIGNDPIIFAFVWGAYRIGAYITPIASGASPDDAAYIVQDSDAKLVLVNARLEPDGARMRALVPNAPRWLSVHGAIAGFEPIEPLLQAAPHTPVDDETSGSLMMYTSGTTGKPKGVLRPLPPGLLASPPFASDLLSIFDIREGSRYLSTQPLYHAAALRFGLAFLAAGGTVVVMPKFDAGTALDLLESERITHSQWVPTMFSRMLALPAERRASFHAPAHRVAIHGAAPCPVPVKRALIEWWGPIVEEYYAGSEGVGLTKLDSHEWLQHPGSVGRAKKGEPHVLDDDDREVATGTTGRIFFSGVAPFAYYNSPDKTATRTSSQGWQTLGDIGYVDAEGFLYLTDRQDDMIISGGVNIYPQELEAALLEMPGVSEAAVIGAPDADFGERPVAFVVRRDPSLEARVFEEQVAAWCLQRLGRIKRPKEIRIVDGLPYSPQGKLLRRELRRQLA